MKPAIDPLTPIGRLAAEHPAWVAVFERFGLDYCCRGRRAFSEACVGAGVDPDTVVEAIGAGDSRAETPDRDWTSATMTELADHIEATHHAFTREAFARLATMVPKLVTAHGAAHPELAELSRLVAVLRDDMMDHMVREERVLFPWFRRLERPSEIQSGPPWSVRRPIDCMLHDHDAVAEILRAMRALTGGFKPPAGACVTYRGTFALLERLEAETHVHIHKENNILFPAGVRAEEARAGRSHRHAAAPQA